MKKKLLTLLAIGTFIAANPAAAADGKYSQGVFIINEDWYGTNSSSVNFLDDNGEWSYRVFQTENPGMELGCTAEAGQIYGGKFFIMAKQPDGIKVKGGRLTVCDASTMKALKQFPELGGADGRGFLGVDEHKGYVGTTNGIYVLDIDALEISGSVKNSGGTEIYAGEIGNMVRVNDYVFAIHRDDDLLVIDPTSDTVLKVLSAPDNMDLGSIVLSKDGTLWCSLIANGNAANSLWKINPATLETEVVALPDGIYGPANSWYAWTPDAFCASTQNNVLYWNGGASSWTSGYMIFKYDIDTNTATKIVDIQSEGWQIYGCSMRVDPVSNEIYATLNKNWSNEYITRIYNADGEKVKECALEANYWFPAQPVFPDNEEPTVKDLGVQKASASEETTISLKDWASDADNLSAAIVKTVIGTGSDAFTAKISNGDLVITPVSVSEGLTSNVDIKVNSNGKIVNSSITIEFGKASGVEASTAAEVSVKTLGGKAIRIANAAGKLVEVYNFAGAVVASFTATSDSQVATLDVNAGVYIVKVAGTTHKTIVK